ncbi:unnamed protein product [Closterium sp. NIES-54]
MVPRHDLFTTYHSLLSNSRNVIVGSGDTLQAIGIDPITVKGKEGSRLSWVTLVKTKDEVAKVFKRWIRYAEREARAKVKILRPDRGGEYMGKDMESFFEDKGITYQLSVAYTPQQNGAAERLNQTLIDLARAMLAHAQLDHTWSKAWMLWSVAVQRVVDGRDVVFHEGLSYKGWKKHGASTVGSSLQDPYTSSIFEGAWEDPREEIQEQQEEQKAAAPHHEESPSAGSTPDPNAPAHDPEQPQGQQQQQEKPQQPPQKHKSPVPMGRWQQLLQQLSKSPRSPMKRVTWREKLQSLEQGEASPLRRTTRISRPPERFTPSLLELLKPAQPRTPGFRSWPYSLVGLRTPRLVVSTYCPPFPPAPTAEPASGDSPNLLGVSRTVDASPGMVTIPPFPFLAADGPAVSVSPHPAFPLAGSVGLANASRQWASGLFPSLPATSLITSLPSLLRGAEHPIVAVMTVFSSGQMECISPPRRAARRHGEPFAAHFAVRRNSLPSGRLDGNPIRAKGWPPGRSL